MYDEAKQNGVAATAVDFVSPFALRSIQNMLCVLLKWRI
jgi:hypothetical protein